MTYPKTLSTALFLTISPIISAVAQADTLNLVNGDRITGRIVAEQPGAVIFESPLMGQITIPRTQVRSITAGNQPQPTAPDRAAPSLANGYGRANDRAAVPPIQRTAPVAAPQTAAAPAEASTQAETETTHPGDYKWSGMVNVGGTLQNGNTESKSVTADADVKARNEKNRFAMGLDINWGQEDGVDTDDNQEITGTYDRFLNEKWFIGGTQSFKRDKFEELDLRSRTGIFSGYQFYERDDLNLQIKAGPEYIYEKFDDGSDDSHIALAWKADYDQKFHDGLFQIFHNHGLSAPVDETSGFLFESESGIRVPLNEHINASAQIDFDWDNEPAPGVKEDDTTYALKVGYEW